jgi:hypothetical protein
MSTISCIKYLNDIRSPSRYAATFQHDCHCADSHAAATPTGCYVKLYNYRVFRAQADWTFILPSELPAKELLHLPRKMQPRTEKSDKPSQ